MSISSYLLRMLGFSLIATAITAHAQLTNGGWYCVGISNASGTFVPDSGEDDGAQTPQSPPGGSPVSIAEAITPEIQNLADSLQDNPTNIFDYVHDQIRFVLYFGAKKGATLTLLEKSGNDFDQCALLMALLRAAGYTNMQYKFGWMLIPYDDPSGDDYDLHHWWQLSYENSDVSTTTNYLATLLINRGYPAWGWYSYFNEFEMQRVWVALTVGANTYQLDPAFKISEPVQGIDLAEAIANGVGIPNSVSNSLGAHENLGERPSDAYYVTQCNETGLDYLLTSTYSENLVSYIQNNMPNAGVQDVLGGWTIVSAYNPWDYSTYTTFETTTFGGLLPILSWTNEPTNMMSTLNIGFDGINYQWFMPQLQGQRLSLTMDSSGNVDLWQDDSILTNAFTSGSGTTQVAMLVHHPAGGTWNLNNNTYVQGYSFDQMTTNTYQSANAAYALLYAFEPDWGWLQQREDKLDAYLQQGLDEGSTSVICETLNIIGLSWMMQSTQTEQILGCQLDMLPMWFHRLGRMGWANGRGYYVDAYMEESGVMPSDGMNYNSQMAMGTHFDLNCYFGSALEAGLIEELQDGGIVGASTVSMIAAANANSERIYLFDEFPNWGQVMRSTLAGNYSASVLSTFSNLINNGHIILAPEYGTNYVAGPGTWAGDVYIDCLPLGASGVEEMDMKIAGDYNGGYSSQPVDPSPTTVQLFEDAQPNFFDPQTSDQPHQTVHDPVNVADGSFELTSTDLTVGVKEPRGLSLARSYSSARRNVNVAGMGPGWLHSYYCRAVPGSAPQAGLGGTTPAQMIPMLVATCVAINFYNNAPPDPENWTGTALIAKWAADQLTNNGVSINLGNQTVQFVQQPNHTFAPPANCTMSLSMNGGTYTLQERHGRTFAFNPDNCLATITDPYGQVLNVDYNAAGFVSQVTDWKNRSLTFNYTGNQLTSVTDSSGRSVHYGYTGQVMTSYVDPEQKETSYQYDTNNQIIATFDALGHIVVTNTYDAYGHITTQLTEGNATMPWRIYASEYRTIETDPAGDQRIYAYDSKLRLISYQDGVGNVTQNFYDGQDHLIESISPLGETNTFDYDGNNNLLSTTDPGGAIIAYTYDANQNLVAVTDARGNVSHFGYNSQFSLTGRTNGNGDWTAFSFNTDGTLASRQDSAGTTTYGYDTWGQLSSVNYPAGSGNESYVNSVLGDVTSHTDARGFTTAFTYNNRRQLTSVTAPTNLATAFAYDSDGHLSTSTNPRGFVFTNVWSTTGHLLSTLLPSTSQGAPVISNIYDTRYWLHARYNPLGKATVYTNDAAQKLISTTDPLQRTSHLQYDGDSQETNCIDPASESTMQQWDNRGNLVKVVDAAANIVARAYDKAGNLVYLTNRNGHVWGFQYDGANRLTNTISPLGHSASSVFNNRGLVQSTTDAKNQTTTYAYDLLGRTISRADAMGTTTYQRDLNGNITSLSDTTNGTLSWVYDAYNRPTSYTDANGFQVKYAYDANSNLTQLIYPGNRTVSYTYDSNDRLTGVTDWAGRHTVFAYDIAGRLTSVTRPNNTTRTASYDDANETTNIIERGPNQFPIAYFILNYGLAGRVQSEFKGPLSHAYAVPSRTMTYDEDNELESFDGTNVTLDADGNLTYGPETNGVFMAYGYDARNELTSADGLGYAYDGAGNRTSLKLGGGSVETFVTSLKKSQMLMRINGTTTNYYVYGIELLYEIDETPTTTNVAFYHFDMRGSTVALTDADGNVTDTIEYNPYGGTTYRTGANNTPFLYNGQYGVQTDPNGLLYMRARYYNPYISRFINADPSGFHGGLNFFLFCNDNPISNEDPFGLQVPSPIETAVGFGPGWGQSPGEYVNQVQAVGQQALAIEGVVGGGAFLGGGLSAGVGAGATALVSAGVPQNVVAGGLLVTGAVGLYTTGADINNNPSVYNIAFNAGTLGGGAIAGDLMGFNVASALSPEGYKPISEVSLGSDVSMVWKDSSGFPNPLAFLYDWLVPGADVGPMSTGPSTVSAAVTMAGAASGFAAGGQLVLGNPPK